MDTLGPVWPEAPRHAPDLSLPRYRFVPELYPHPRRSPDGSLFDAPEAPPGLAADRWREDAAYLGGVDLYHLGYLWEAHEWWEACFFPATDPAQRDLLQALIQIAAALLNVHRGKASGVRFLVGQVRKRLGTVAETAAGARIAGLDPAALLADVERHFAGAVTDDDPLRTAGHAPRLVLAD